MGAESIISPVLPNYMDLIGELVNLDAQFFVGGVLAAFIAWSIGIAVYTAFHWLNNWSR